MREILIKRRDIPIGSSLMSAACEPMFLVNTIPDQFNVVGCPRLVLDIALGHCHRKFPQRFPLAFSF